MTFKYNKVYVLDTSLVAGPYESKGPMKKYFDLTFNDLYNGCKTFEKAETKSVDQCFKILLNKTNTSERNIDLVIGGDLLNQITATCYGTYFYNRPFLGIYGACSTSCEGIIIGSSLIDSKKINNSVVITSSHNMTSERQFRNPTEYGAPKPKTATFTSTGAASIFLTNKKTNVKVESSTIGKMIDYNQNNPLDMGSVMAPAACDTLYKHLTDLKRNANYYDLILTGDLGKYGKNILIDLMKEKYDIDISKNYNDCGCMLYDFKKQKNVLAGGSGPVCNCLVNYGYILDMLRKKEIKRLLIIATGALFSPTFIYQKNNILSIAHAVSLEAI